MEGASEDQWLVFARAINIKLYVCSLLTYVDMFRLPCALENSLFNDTTTL
jgi:hypothetical protein